MSGEAFHENEEPQVSYFKSFMCFYRYTHTAQKILPKSAVKHEHRNDSNLGLCFKVVSETCNFFEIVLSIFGSKCLCI